VPHIDGGKGEECAADAVIARRGTMDAAHCWRRITRPDPRWRECCRDGPTARGKTSLVAAIAIDHARDIGPVVVMSRALPADEFVAGAIPASGDQPEPARSSGLLVHAVLAQKAPPFAAWSGYRWGERRGATSRRRSHWRSPAGRRRWVTRQRPWHWSGGAATAWSSCRAPTSAYIQEVEALR